MLDFEETIMEFEELSDEELIEDFKKYRNISPGEFDSEEEEEDAFTKQSAIIDVMERRGLEV